ncbi:right-handed parallel beta-helix repeat-containing protein [Vibrio kasasachensis]|uniref:NosD domain-containing protein n=1 Tax=Vibrio kasasachensis TaxID=2910248 RepID=UPI003D0B49BB
MQPFSAPALPDLSMFNEAYFYDKLSLWSTRAKVSLERLPEQQLIRRFQLISDMATQAKAQGGLPKIIVVQDGLATLSDISKSLPEALVKVEGSKNTYLARYPIVVRGDAALLIGKGEELRLSEEKRSFLAGGGEFFILSGALKSWRESENTPSYWTGDRDSYRAFYSAWNGSRTYFYDSTFESLGYFKTKSYGVSLTSQKIQEKDLAQMPWIDKSRSTGVLMGNKFIDIYYGFYCYKAEDVVIIDNEYIKNIVYGIDPHDISERLVIAKNKTWGTIQKHGIIISREVNNSFIFENISYDNNRSGIMLDRSSINNIVAKNTAFNNGGDGLTIQESNDNIIWNNLFYDNREHGINVRNSQNIHAIDNDLIANGGSGLYAHIDDLKEHTHRDLELDPFETKISLYAIGGKIVANATGAISMSNFEYATIGEVAFSDNGAFSNRPYQGELKPFQYQIDSAIRNGQSLMIHKSNTKIQE